MISIVNTIFLAIILAVSIWLHEYAHAIASIKLWDPTPKLQWRDTPNPLAHLDIVWFLMIFLISFGWWKPVQVNPAYYKNPLRDELIVSLAGPFTNLLLWTFWILIMLIYWKFALHFDIPILVFWPGMSDLIIQFWLLFCYINFGLAVFNLIPLPPLDWYRIIKFLRPKFGFQLERNYRTILIVFLAIIIFGWWIIWNFIATVVDNLFWPIFMLLSWLIY